MKIDAILRRLSDKSASALDEMPRMLEDCRLPLDVRPVHPPVETPPGYVMLTGATGFLGAYLLRAILESSEARVCCLVRDGSAARNRVRENLESYGIWDPAFDGRIDIVDGNLSCPRAGMAATDYSLLADSIDAVYHCAASVNWIFPYRKLAGSNVRGTLELLRFACMGKAKAFHFISSSSVGYSTAGPRYVDESTDMMPFIGGIHLGYAQAKCVAESLVRQAGSRGLPVRIFRPALISGDSRTGQSNGNDFLSRFIKGCIEMGSAPELDWLLDCCPVDFAAESIVKLSRYGAGNPVFHLINPERRYWHECILWINLFGYQVRLLPYREWLCELKRHVELPHHPLRELAPFFCRTIPGDVELHLPQFYEEARKSLLGTAQSERALESVQVSCPPLNAQLLDRYFESFVATGFLPPLPKPSLAASGSPQLLLDCRFLSSVIGRKVSSATPVPGTANHSIVAELTSWRFKTRSGLFRYLLELEGGETLNAMVKLKPSDSEVLEVGEAIAHLCSDALGGAYAEFRHGMEFVRCHLREPAVYAQADPRFRKHAPALYGAAGNTLIVEYLSDVVLKDSVNDVSEWSVPYVKAALEGAASLHSIWFGRTEDLHRSEGIGPTLPATDMAALTPFWIALADNARSLFSSWIGTDVRAIQERLIASLPQHARLTRELPATLIHNDFNPRNVAFRKGAEPRLCAYDWEMAKVGLPQHDLAEMLCFVLPGDVDKTAIHSLLEFHRVELERASGLSIARDGWHLGFRLSLEDLMINRLAMYAMVHRFRRQAFLERVFRTWYRLYVIHASPS